MHRLKMLVVLSFAAPPLAAQMDRAALTGTIMDPSKSLIPNAKVVRPRGCYRHRLCCHLQFRRRIYTHRLPVGQYAAAVSASGFDTVQIQAFALEVGETRTLTPTLSLSSVSSNVTVEAATTDLKLANAEVGGVIAGAQTEELPVNGRYWASLEALIPGDQRRYRHTRPDPI